MWCGVVWCGVVWCGVVWCGVVWCGVVWCGVVWCGVVWCGVVWCGVVSCPLRGSFSCCFVLLFSNKAHSAAQVLASSRHHNLDNTSFRKLGLNLLSTDEGLDEAALTQSSDTPPTETRCKLTTKARYLR